MNSPTYYGPSNPRHISHVIERMEFKLQRLRIEREINDVDEKLKILESCRRMYPPNSPPKARQEP
jgi:hypothetical protein